MRAAPLAAVRPRMEAADPRRVIARDAVTASLLEDKRADARENGSLQIDAEVGQPVPIHVAMDDPAVGVCHQPKLPSRTRKAGRADEAERLIALDGRVGVDGADVEAVGSTDEVRDHVARRGRAVDRRGDDEDVLAVVPRQPVRAGLADQNVVTAPAHHGVVAAPAHKNVVAHAARQHVVPCTARQHIVARVADDLVVARAAVDDVVRLTASQEVVAGPAEETIRPEPAAHDVVPGAAVQTIIAGRAEQDVAAPAAAQDVVTVQPRKLVAAIAAGQHIGTGRALLQCPADVDAQDSRRGDRHAIGRQAVTHSRPMRLQIDLEVEIGSAHLDAGHVGHHRLLGGADRVVVRHPEGGKVRA